MSYIEKNLLANEEIYYRTKRHWVIFNLPILFTVLGMVFLFQQNLLALLGYLFMLMAVVQWITAIIIYITSEYGVTNKRVLIKIGFVRRQSWETLLQKVASLEVHQSIWGRMLGYGTLVVQSTGGSKDYFAGIDDPLLLRRKIQEQIELRRTTAVETKETP